MALTTRQRGKRREVAWAAFLPVPASLWQTQLVTRGFTGHEQLDPVGLVHMNGRVYDPELGRFLSADPHIQDVTNGQALNRYSYVLNNPLSFTDPSGFFFQSLFKAIGHAVGAVFRAIGRVFSALLKSAIFRSIVQVIACANPYAAATCPAASAALTLATGGSVLDAFKAAAISVASAYVWNKVGDFLDPFMKSAADFGEKLVVHSVTHGVVGGALSVTQGGEFLPGFAVNAIGGAASMATEPGQPLGLEGPARLAVVATSGGLASELTGGKFANGAITASFAHLYNDVFHAEAELHVPAFAQKFACRNMGACSVSYSWGAAVSYPGYTDASWDLGTTMSYSIDGGIDASKSSFWGGLKNFLRSLPSVGFGKTREGFDNLSGQGFTTMANFGFIGVGEARNSEGNPLGNQTKFIGVGWGGTFGRSYTKIRSIRGRYGYDKD